MKILTGKREIKMLRLIGATRGAEKQHQSKTKIWKNVSNAILRDVTQIERWEMEIKKNFSNNPKKLFCVLYSSRLFVSQWIYRFFRRWRSEKKVASVAGESESIKYY